MTGRSWPGSWASRPHQLSYVTHSGEGEGLLFFGSTSSCRLWTASPPNTELYRIMTTKPQEMKEADGR